MSKRRVCHCVLSSVLIGLVFTISGCETEQSSSKNNDGMVGDTQEQAKRQAELFSQEHLKDSSLKEAKAVTNDSVQ